MPKFDLAPLSWGPPWSRSSRVPRGHAWVPEGRVGARCLRPGVGSAAVGVAPCQGRCNAAGPVPVDEQCLIWGGAAVGPTLLRGSTRCGVSTKGLEALLQPGQKLGGQGTHGVT